MIELRIPFDICNIEIHDKEIDTYFTNHIFSWMHIDYTSRYIFPLKRYETTKSGYIFCFKDEISEWLSNLDLTFTYEPYSEEFIITFNKEEDAVMFKLTWM